MKYKLKILTAAAGAVNSASSASSLTIAFLGTSITAGHSGTNNCPVNFPNFVKDMLLEPFKAAGIQLITRNSGIGNHPCIPYDMCAQAFAGSDADIIHWEHTTNCLGDDPEFRPCYEHFIRQSLSLPYQPIIVMSKSKVPSWSVSSCPVGDIPTPASSPSAEDFHAVSLLKTNALQVYSDLNRKDWQLHSDFSAMTEIFNYYSNYTGLQLFRHDFNEEYKCHGPYISNWGVPSDHHPSLLGHRMWADRLALVWLQIFKEALVDVIKAMQSDSASAILKLVESEWSSPKVKYNSNTSTLYSSPYGDSYTCYTTFQPIAYQSLNLSNLIIPSKTSSSTPFNYDIWERHTYHEAYIRGENKSCTDKKYVLFGNQQSQPLSLKLQVKRQGIIHLCEMPPPPVKYFTSLDDITKVYITANVNTEIAYKEFDFNLKRAKEFALLYKPLKPKTKIYHYNKNYCVELGGKVDVGDHVLTIIPQTKQYVMLSFILIP